MACFESAFVYHLIANGLNMLLVEGSISKCVAVIVLGRGRNQGVSLQSGSFSVDQFCESVVYMRLSAMCEAYMASRSCLGCSQFAIPTLLYIL